MSTEQDELTELFPMQLAALTPSTGRRERIRLLRLVIEIRERYNLPLTVRTHTGRHPSAPRWIWHDKLAQLEAFGA